MPVLKGGFQPIVFHKLVSSVPIRWSIQSDMGITLNSAGSTVNVWADQALQSGSTGGGIITFSTGSATAQPAYNATGLNGFPTLTFDGSNDCLAGNFAVPASATASAWIWMVLKQVSWTKGDDFFGGGSFSCQQNNTAGSGVTPNLCLAGNGLGPQLLSAAAVGSWFRMETFYSNSASDFIKVAGTTATGTGAGSIVANRFGMGAYVSNTNNVQAPANIEVAAMLVTIGQPSTAEKAALSAAAQRKYGTTVLI